MKMDARGEIKAEEALGLLKGWFNNKMMVIIFRIQYATMYKRKNNGKVQEHLIFLHDIQHHFARKGADSKAYYKAIRWLKAFFRVFPNKITPDRAQKAWKMLRPVYQGFGLKFPFNEDGTRNGPAPFSTKSNIDSSGEEDHDAQKDNI